MYELLSRLAVAITVGICAGVAVGLFRKVFFPKSNGDAGGKQQAPRAKQRAFVFSITMGVLCIGLVWTVFFLVLGATDPAHTEYANNISQLIVSALTVFSIIIAFWQFMQKR